MDRTTTTELRTTELQIRQFCVDWLATDCVNVRVTEQFVIDSACRALRADIWLPAQLLQEDRKIAAWPANLWQYIRKALGWKYKRATVRLNEWLLFPNVPLPPGFKTNQRLFVKYYESSEMPDVPRDW